MLHHLLHLCKNLLFAPTPPTKRFWGCLSLIFFNVMFFLATTHTSPPFPPCPPRRGRPIPPLPPRTYRRRLSTKFPYCMEINGKSTSNQNKTKHNILILANTWEISVITTWDWPNPQDHFLMVLVSSCHCMHFVTSKVTQLFVVFFSENSSKGLAKQQTCWTNALTYDPLHMELSTTSCVCACLSKRCGRYRFFLRKCFNVCQQRRKLRKKKQSQHPVKIIWVRECTAPPVSYNRLSKFEG